MTNSSQLCSESSVDFRCRSVQHSNAIMSYRIASVIGGWGKQSSKSVAHRSTAVRFRALCDSPYPTVCGKRVLVELCEFLSSDRNNNHKIFRLFLPLFVNKLGRISYWPHLIKIYIFESGWCCKTFKVKWHNSLYILLYLVKGKGKGSPMSHNLQEVVGEWQGFTLATFQ